MLVLFAFPCHPSDPPTSYYGVHLRFWGEIGNLTTQLIQEMKTQKLLGDYIEGPVTYELGSNLWTGLSFYRLQLLQDKYKYQLESHNPYVFSSHDYREVADTIFSKLPIFCQGDNSG